MRYYKEYSINFISEISNRFACLENVDKDVDISRAWETKNFSHECIDYYELKRHKMWFYEVCSELLYDRKQGKLQLSYLLHARFLLGLLFQMEAHVPSKHRLTFRRLHDFIFEKIHTYRRDGPNCWPLHCDLQ
jgi:hypothetical protein